MEKRVKDKVSERTRELLHGSMKCVCFATKEKKGN